LRVETPNGYIKLYLPDHPLADSQGGVFEHRVVMWNATDGVCEKCELCGNPETWETCHVDHRNDIRTDNDPPNLRILCRGCNVMRGHTATSMGSFLLTVNGVTMTSFAWSRQPGVRVNARTIRDRRRRGATDHQAIYGEKVTHRRKDAKKPTAKHDEARGIGKHLADERQLQQQREARV